MLKMKICATVFVLYEIAAVLLLHCPMTCNAMFGPAFCNDSVFKYFIALLAVPAVAALIVMWIMHIIHAVRRRHSFLYRAQEAVGDVAASIKKTLKESVSSQDIEKYIMVALMAGIKKYSDKNPDIKKSFGNIINAISGKAGEYMDIEAEYDSEDDVPAGNRRTAARHTTKYKSRTQKRAR